MRREIVLICNPPQRPVYLDRLTRLGDRYTDVIVRWFLDEPKSIDEIFVQQMADVGLRFDFALSNSYKALGRNPESFPPCRLLRRGHDCHGVCMLIDAREEGEVHVYPSATDFFYNYGRVMQNPGDRENCLAEGFMRDVMEVLDHHGAPPCPHKLTPHFSFPGYEYV